MSLAPTRFRSKSVRTCPINPATAPTPMAPHALELKIPPPLVALCVALMMWFTTWIVGPIDVPRLLRVGAALALLVVGLGFDVAGPTIHVVNHISNATQSATSGGGIFSSRACGVIGVVR